MNSPSLTVRPAFAIFALWVLLFALILLNGYALNLLGLPANAWALAILIALECAWLARALWHRRVRLAGHPLELASFLIVVVGVWLYFVYAAWPTLLPPTLSGDAVHHHAQTNTIFETGLIFADYPGGAALIAATLSHWIGLPPLRLEHPIAALWIALTAGGMYGPACAMLPDRGKYKVIGLFAPFALFVPWYYFAGTLVNAHYFYPQVAGQLFLIAFVWFLVEYRTAPSLLWAIGMAFCLSGITVTFQLWLPLPLALLVWQLAADVLASSAPRRTFAQSMRAVLVVAGIPALLWLAILVAGSRFIPKLSRLQTIGAVAPPSWESLGGWFMVLPALGILLALFSHYRAGTELIWTALTGLQVVAFIAGNRWFGLADYWVDKAFFLVIFPLALFTVIPLARIYELPERYARRVPLVWAWGIVVVILSGLVWTFSQPPQYSPLTESEIQVGLWAREHLPTRHINLVGRKSLAAMWLGEGLWGDHYPDDLFADLAVLGPKTFEEWRGDPDWGEYLYISSEQHLPLDNAMQTLYQYGDAAVVKRPIAHSRPPDEPPLGSFGEIFALRDYALPLQTVRAGESISLTTKLETLRLPAFQVVWRNQLVDVRGNAVTETREDPFGGKFPLHRWPDGIVLSQPFTLPLPLDVKPGIYNLRLGLYYVGSGEPVRFRAADGAVDDTIAIGRIKVALPAPDKRELETLTRTDARFGEGFTLLGYRLGDASQRIPGASFKIDLYWQGDPPVQKDYTVFVHLLDANGTIRAQRDSAPRDGTYPTSFWEKGEIVVDSYTLAWPRDLPPGSPALAIGMYEWPSLQRLPVQDASQRALGDQLLIPLE